jgi:hypothetical protein
MLTDHINDEQLLSILLDNQANVDYNMDGLSGELITLYCMEKLGVETPFDRVYEEVTILIADHIKENLVKDGFLEPEYGEGGITYRMTSDGEAMVKQYKEVLEENHD